MDKIHFHPEDVDFNLSDDKQIAAWIDEVVRSLNLHLREINFIFCSDEYLLEINNQYLNHDYFTDIITFDNSESENDIEGDIFVSIDRVADNAEQMNIPFKDELHRVLIHGILHLAGLQDSTTEQKATMRKSEDHYLALRKF